MSLLIQNMACIEVNLDPNSHRFYFNEDKIKGIDKIDSIILFFDNYNPIHPKDKIRNPFSTIYPDINNELTSSSLLDKDGLYLNIANDKSEIVSNLFFQHLNGSSALKNVLFLNLNRKIDVSKSFFSYNTNVPIRFLCYITYFTKHIKTIIESPISGSFSADIQIDTTKTFQDIKLSNIIPLQRKNLKIRKISSSGSYSFLYLVGKENLIENIPFKWFGEKNSNSEILLDDIEIDFEQSYFKFRNLNPSDRKFTLTFYY